MSDQNQSEAKPEVTTEETPYKTIERVTANPTAKSYIDSAVHIYEKAKESSPIVKSTLEMVEATTQTTINMIPVSVLQTADAVGVVGLDKLAEGKERLETVYENVKKDLSERIVATDEYLKGVPVVATPANTILNVGENVTNRVFPEEKTKEGDDAQGQQREDGPLFRAGKLSYRVTEQTLAAIRGMTLKDLPSQGAKSAHLAIDLLSDAAHTLESMAKGVTHSVSSHIPSTEGLNESLQSGASEAIGRLTAALQVLSSSPVVAKAFEMKPIAAAMDTEFYQKNAEKLREAGKILQEHVDKGDVPAFIYESVTSVVTSVRDSLTQKAPEAKQNSSQ